MAKTNVKVEIFYSGSWHDITLTDDVYTRAEITITRGRADESQRVAPSTLSLTLNNTSGKFSRRNPMSPLYGLIGRNTPIRVSVDGSYRFWGEVESWPQRRSVDGNDAWAPITAYGILRRLNAPGTTRPSVSALTRTLSTSPYAGLLGWWALEDIGQAVKVVPSMLPLGASLTINDSAFITRSTDDTMAGSAPLIKTTLGVGSSIGASNYGGPVVPGRVALLPSTGNSWSMLFWTRTRLLEDNPATTTVTVEVKVSGSPQIDTWIFGVRHNNFSVAARVEISAFALDAAGVVVSAVSFPATVNMGYVDAWRMVRVNVDLSGSDHRLRIWLDETLVSTVTAASNTPGQPSGVYVQTQVGNSAIPISFGQMLFSGGTGSDIIDDNAAALFSAGRGYVGETAAARLTRLCAEDDIALTIIGDPATSELVGVQRVAPFLELLNDAAEADGGPLYEPRDSLGLAYRVHTDLYSQNPTLTLNYAIGDEVAPELVPVDDTDATGNDITVKRLNGSSARVVQETGPLNVQESSDDPNGVGRYRRDFTLVLADDGQCLDQAAWRKHLGTWDEARYPLVNVDVTALREVGKTALVANAVALDIGGRFVVVNLPAFEGTADQLAQGFTEVLGSHHRTIAINATPAGPYRVHVLDDPAALEDSSRIGSGTAVLAVSLDTVATSFRGETGPGGLWTTSGADLPLHVNIDGERIRVTAIANFVNAINANPFFESPLNASSWTAQNGATIAASGAQFHQGSQSLLVTPDGVSFAPQATSEEVIAFAGTSYTLSGWIRSTNNATRKLGIFWYNASHALLSSNEISIALTAGVWTQYGPTSFVAPANTAFLRVFTNDPGAPAAANTWFLDEATVTSGGAQVFTCTRSVNGVVKAHNAGAAVEQWRTAVIGL